MWLAINLLVFSIVSLILEYVNETRKTVAIDGVASFLVVLAFFLAGNDGDPYAFVAGLVHFFHILAVLLPEIFSLHWPSSLKVGYFGVAFVFGAKGILDAALLVLFASLLFFVAHLFSKDVVSQQQIKVNQ